MYCNTVLYEMINRLFNRIGNYDTGFMAQGFSKTIISMFFKIFFQFFIWIGNKVLHKQEHFYITTVSTETYFENILTILRGFVVGRICENKVSQNNDSLLTTFQSNIQTFVH